MNTLKKTIVLTNKEDTKNNAMAILTLSKQNGSIFGTIKTYNFQNKSDLILGIKNNNNIIKQNIMLNNNSYNFKCQQSLNLEDSIGCVLLQIENSIPKPILWGSEKSENFKSQIVQNLKNSMQKIATIHKKPDNIPIKVTPNTESHENFVEQPQDNSLKNRFHQIIDIINDNIDTQNPTLDIPNITEDKNNLDNSIVYPIKNGIISNTPSNYELFDASQFSQIAIDEETVNSMATGATVMSDLFESSDDEINATIDNEMTKDDQTNFQKTHKFYSMIAEQLDDLFDKYPREENLGRLIENSKWVKIKYDDSEKFYVVGIIFQDNDVKYICYGVPGSYNTEPPIEIRNYSQWLPTNTRNPYDNGYWVMYQDADTGDNIYLN